MIDKYKGTYRIPSARFAPHNYNEGTFFVTICTHERKHYFGNIIDEKMCLSKLGVYTEYCISQIPIINKHVILHSYVVMPNHIHMIVIVSEAEGINPFPTMAAVQRGRDESLPYDGLRCKP